MKLELLTIPTPCHANWAAMAGDDRVRHCRECHLDVFDLSAMTREEAQRLVEEREGRLCVTFWKRADGTVITQDCEPLRGEPRACTPRMAPHPHAPSALAAAPEKPKKLPRVRRPAAVEPPPVRMMGTPPTPIVPARWEAVDARLDRDTVRAEVIRAVRSIVDPESAEAKVVEVEALLSSAPPADRAAECTLCHGPLWIPAKPAAQSLPPDAKRKPLVDELTPILKSAFDAPRFETLLRELRRSEFTQPQAPCPHCRSAIAAPRDRDTRTP